MLWYKAWLETRWRFYVGLALLTGLSALVVLTYPLASKIVVSVVNPGGWIGERVRTNLAIISTYRGYVWAQWFGQNLHQVWTVFAILIGVGGIVTESTRGSALFTLSLPVTRRRLLGVRAATGVIELAVLAIVPSLLIPAFSLWIGQTFAVTDAVVYGLMTFVGGLAFFGLSFLLATVFSDQLKPIIIGLCVAFLIGMLSLMAKELAPYSLYAVMSGKSYFLSGKVPWFGLAISPVLAAAMFYLAIRIVERRDF
jgi:ABC-type transport system involved in multi-copper enzyme maturation permease subunit